MPDDRLTIVITHASGRTTRWGPDEVDGKNVPTDLTFGTSIPGGYSSCSCSLLRRLDQQYPDQDLFDTVTVYGSGGRIVWQGRSQQFPRSQGDTGRITPGAVGWSAHLRDDPSFREIFVDRDLGQWGQIPLNERVRLAGGSDFATLVYTNDGGALMCALPVQSVGAAVDTQAWYTAPVGCTIKFVYYNGQRASWPGTWNTPIIRFHVADSFAGTTQTVTPTLDSTVRLATATTARRYVSTEIFTGAIATPTVGAQERWTTLTAIGGHGVTPRSIAGEPDGFYASDVVANVVSRAAPLLTYSTGTGGSIDATTFPIPHLVYRDPVTAEFAVSDVNKYHLYDWGVYDNLEFFYRQPDPDRVCWEARLGDGSHMDADGLTGEQVINGVFVTYTDATGAQKTVGPPGGSFDATDAALEDTSVENPANSHSIPAKWHQLSLSFPTTLAGATQIGAVYLAERSLATRRGSLTITGSVIHPIRGRVPVSEVRAGDWVRVTDLDGENASVQRKIIETSYAHGPRTNTLSLDNTVAKLDAILARVGVQTGIMTGGGF